ncbi:MAG: DUF4340 domain-containing protein [Cytophagales bacterium]|nr:DUF4340 domain-containing protein [Cytophagales bacterium]
MKKTSGTKWLIIILLILVVVFLLNHFFGDDGTRSDDFKGSIGSKFDAKEVTRLYVSNPDTEIRIEREGTQWVLVIRDDKRVPARVERVSESLDLLGKMKLDQLVSRKKEDWNKFRVDSLGTRVEAYAGDKKVFDIVLGSTEYGQNSTYIYLRNPSDDKTYTLRNIYLHDFFQSPDSYRLNQLSKIEPDSVESFSLRSKFYGDYTLRRSGEDEDGVPVWKIGSEKAELVRVDAYLESLEYLSSSKYDDEFVPPITVDETLIIKERGDISTTLKAYQIDTASWIVNSSFNESSFFRDKKLREDIFKSKDYFLNKSAK